uniref:Uncharacterized protein n=1 Tax=Tetranychus urticae TaxID=32264 RepID=T1K4H3_TETUR
MSTMILIREYLIHFIFLFTFGTIQ